MLTIKSLFRSKITLGLIALSLLSCDRQGLYDTSTTFSEQKWNKDSVCVFEYDHQSGDSSALVFSLNLRNTIDYDYSNLWLFTEVTLPGKAPQIDTINCLLRDKKGFWRDYVSGGSIKESRFKLFATKARNGCYTVKIKHGMRQLNLTEIVSIGTRIEKLEP